MLFLSCPVRCTAEEPGPLLSQHSVLPAFSRALLIDFSTSCNYFQDCLGIWLSLSLLSLFFFFPEIPPSHLQHLPLTPLLVSGLFSSKHHFILHLSRRANRISPIINTTEFLSGKKHYSNQPPRDFYSSLHHAY